MATVLAMEHPVSFDPDRLRDEKVRVLRSMQLVDPARVVRGQYVGYRDERDVAREASCSRLVRWARDAHHRGRQHGHHGQADGGAGASW